MSNTNARKEFVAEIEDRAVLCAVIQFGYSHSGEGREIFRLPVGFTADQYDAFLSSLDFKYDSGYGGQELYGLIWYQDGTWSERGEYDGSEWWDYKVRPDIPEDIDQCIAEPKPVSMDGVWLLGSEIPAELQFLSSDQRMNVAKGDFEYLIQWAMLTDEQKQKAKP